MDGQPRRDVQLSVRSAAASEDSDVGAVRCLVKWHKRSGDRGPVDGWVAQFWVEEDRELPEEVVRGMPVKAATDIDDLGDAPKPKPRLTR